MQEIILEQKKDEKTRQLITTVLISAYALQKLKDQEQNKYYEQDILPIDPYSLTKINNADRYETIYGRDRRPYFDVSGAVRGWVDFELPDVWNILPDEYGEDANNTNLHEVNGHLQYRTGHEEFVRGLARYMQALGERTNRVIRSYRKCC